MAKATPEMKLEAQARVVGLLNEVERKLTGWVIGEPREEVERLLDPLYDLCDKD